MYHWVEETERGHTQQSHTTQNTKRMRNTVPSKSKADELMFATDQ